MQIAVKSMLYKLSNISQNLGFLIAEEYDFGAAKSINSLFTDLLNLSPFSKSEISEYSDFLSQRNLLVHHGGIFTTKYASQKFGAEQAKNEVHMNSLVVRKSDVLKRATFLASVAEKLAESSTRELRKFGIDNEIAFAKHTATAIDALNWK